MASDRDLGPGIKIGSGPLPPSVEAEGDEGGIEDHGGG